MLKKRRKVLLLLETSREYGRGLLRGILRYSALHGPWQFEWQEPFYLESSRSARRTDTDLTMDVGGIIMREQRDNEPYLKLGVPVIFASYLNDSIPGTSSIMTGDPAISRCAAEHFFERGLRQFAYLGFDTMYWSERRKKSFRHTVEAKGYPCYVFSQSRKRSQQIRDREQVEVADWIQSLPKPIGLLACNDDRARQAIDACRLVGAHIPDDVSIVGVDNDEFVCKSTFPPLSSVSLNLEAAGYQAAELLDRNMSGRETKPRTIFVKATHVALRQSSEILSIPDPVVLEAVRYIQDNSRRPLQVEDVLAHVAVSRRSLYEKFIRVLGCSVHTYIKKVRIEEIEKLLLETDWTIECIARTLGFSSADHIAAYFRSKTGLNPHKYRLKNRLR